MTRFYKMPGFTLANANLYTKILLTLFISTILCGLWVAWLQSQERVGADGNAATEWVLGNEADPRATEIKVEKGYRELLSITHEHAFTVPILLFVLLHLVAFCSIPEAAKIALATLSFVSFGVSVGGMWLTRFSDPGYAALTVAGGIGLLGASCFSSLLILFEVWLARPLRRWRGLPPNAAVDPMFPRKDGP